MGRLGLVAVWLVGCVGPQQDAPPGDDAPVDAGVDAVTPPSPLALPPTAPDPADNPRTPAKVRKLMLAEMAKWANVAKVANIRTE